MERALESKLETVVLEVTSYRKHVEVENKKIIDDIFKNVPYIVLGKTTFEENVNVSQNGKKIIDVDLGILKKAWQSPMEKMFS